MVDTPITEVGINILNTAYVTLITTILIILTIAKMSKNNKDDKSTPENYPCAVCPLTIEEQPSIECTKCYITLHTKCALGTSECNVAHVTYLQNRDYKCPACIISASEEWKRMISNVNSPTSQTEQNASDPDQAQNSEGPEDTLEPIPSDTESIPSDTELQKDTTPLHTILSSLTEWVAHIDSKSGCSYKQNTNYIRLLDDWKQTEGNINKLLTPSTKDHMPSERQGNHPTTSIPNTTVQNNEIIVNRVTVQTQKEKKEHQHPSPNNHENNLQPNSQQSKKRNKCYDGSECDFPLCKREHPPERRKTTCIFNQKCKKKTKRRMPTLTRPSRD